MSWSGERAPGGSTNVMVGDSVHAGQITTTLEERLNRIVAWVDGAGGTGGTQVFHGGIWNSSNALIGVTEEVSIASGAPMQQIDMIFDEDALALELDPGTYFVGLHVGPISSVARYYGSGVGFRWTDTYVNGTGAKVAGSTPLRPSIALVTDIMWQHPAVEDLHYARHAYPSGSGYLGGTGAVEVQSDRFAECEWYGGTISPEYGAACVAKANGPLEDLVGERLKITNLETLETAVAYCHALSSQIVYDLAVSRRVAIELDFLAVEKMDVIVETLI